VSKSKSPQRLLQKRTGWSYSECLRCVREMTPEAIEVLIKLRACATAAAPAKEKSK
jgi:hypothetical protein